MAGEVSFISIGVGDVPRGAAFYGGLLGWAFEETRGGLVIGGAGVGAGMHGGDAGASPYVFFRVDDLDAALARVEELGGAREPVGEDHGGGDAEEIARFGRFALCRDDQGSAFGLHELPGAGT
jgi:predicted enzyme related to lactoylglutathione lyase